MGSAVQTGWMRYRRALRGFGIAVLALHALYLLAANLFLNTALGPHAINRKPERFAAQWRWAMSLYPGHIHARDVALRGRVRTVEWQAGGSVAHGRIHLLPLLRKRLQFGPIEAGEVTVDVKTGMAPLPATPRRPGAAARKSWELAFERIHSAQVRHLSLDRWRVDGEGEAQFAFYKQVAGGPMEIPPSRFRMRQARLRQGDTVWADRARFDLDLAIARHAPAQVQGLRRLALVDARVQVFGQAPAFELREGSDGRLQVARSGRAGSVSADLQLQRGVLVPGGQVRAQMPLTLIGPDGARRDYPASARVDVRRDALDLKVQVPPQGAHADYIDADLHLPTRDLRPDDPAAMLAKAQGRVGLQWYFGSLAWLNPLLSNGWLKLDGAANLRADLRIDDGRLLPGSSVAIPRAELRADIQDNVVSGVASAEAKIGETQTTLAFAAQKFAIASRDTPKRPYVQGNDLRLDVVSSSDLKQFRQQMQARVRFSGARVPDLRAYNRYLPAGSVTLLGGSGLLDGDLSLDAHGLPERARIGLSGQRAAIRVGVSRISGDLALRSVLHRLSGRRYAVDALQLGLSNVRLAGAPGDGPWWARFRLDGARFGWQIPLRLEGDAQLRMKDVSILLALFAERRAFPGWIGRLIDAGQVDATSRVRVDGRSLVLDGLQAHNDRIDLSARLRLAGDRPTGDLYAGAGILGVGVELRDGRRQLHLFRARRWYESQPALLGK